MGCIRSAAVACSAGTSDLSKDRFGRMPKPAGKMPTLPGGEPAKTARELD